MARLVKSIPDQFSIEFSNGSFDEWCVYLQTPVITRHAPLDTTYFSRLKELGTIHGHEKIYNDYVEYYVLTTKNINEEVNILITELSKKYGPDQIEIDMWFSVIYAGMIAEENKEYAVLKKRIKRLGMYQALIEGLDANIAASFSKGKKYAELNPIMKERGF